MGENKQEKGRRLYPVVTDEVIDWGMPIERQTELEEQAESQGHHLPPRLTRFDQHPGQLDIMTETARLAGVARFAGQRSLGLTA